MARLAQSQGISYVFYEMANSYDQRCVLYNFLFVPVKLALEAG